jgi:hypothetical protein
MTTATRRRILEQTGLFHPRPEAVSAALFDGREPFFLALDKVQVKYEMMRAHVIDGLSPAVAAEQHGYSRAGFYLITTAFDEAGMRGLLDEPHGRRGPLKLEALRVHRICRSNPARCTTVIGGAGAVWRSPATAYHQESTPLSRCF